VPLSLVTTREGASNVPKQQRKLVTAAIIVALGLALIATRRQWLPLLSFPPSSDHAKHSAEAGETHPAETQGLVLSDSAKASLGLELTPVVPSEYWRSVPVPAEVMEEPGHCEQGVSSTMHGIVLKIYAFHGQTVRAGDPLFDIRLTSELLATAQSSLLKSAQDLELAQAELKRILPLGESGGIPASRIIEKQAEIKRLDALRLLQMQELLVRGLSASQIDTIIETKTLVQKLTICVPEVAPQGNSSNDSNRPKSSVNLSDPHSSAVEEPSSKIGTHEHSSVYSIEQLNVHVGKMIQPGEELCRLARHSQLLIAGRAFERENGIVTRVIEKHWPVKVVFEVTDESPVIREGLSILYSDNVVEPDSRTIRFYIPLPNELVRDQPAQNGLSYRSWRFKPGQRAQVLLPIEHLTNQIVLPAEAIVKEGAESFVFRANGRKLERVPVRLLHLDSHDAVIKSDGKLISGDVVAKNQAYQLELALKNSLGGRTSAHAGHDHAGHSHAGHEH
jgi:membrane fusion protein, heavy metal efflux system